MWRLTLSTGALLFVCWATRATQTELAYWQSQDQAYETDECAEFYLPRLPTRIAPLHYDLSMSLKAISFDGSASIDIEIKSELDDGNDQPIGKNGEYSMVKRNQIILHADKSLKMDRVWYLNFGSKNLTVESAKYIDVLSICREETFQLLVVNLAENLEVGSHGRLFFSFSGILNEESLGFNKNNYLDANGQQLYHASTMFEPTHARLAFPCFDEPSFKATFDITCIYMEDKIALANTEPIYEDNGFYERKSTRFATTPPMSTHLVAFIIGKFDFVELKFRDKLTIRAYTPLGERKLGRFALDAAARAIELMEVYFGSEFHLNKLDMVPIQSLGDAKGNWGLIFFDEQQFLMEEQESPETKSRLLVTIAHQIAQQWFGNLVTMESWDDTWLREGILTYLSYNMTNLLYPELQIDHLYLRDSLTRALDDDSLYEARPIKCELLETPKEIERSFDKKIFEKAAAILRNLNNDYLKPTDFEEAIRNYLKSNVYKNTKHVDLWRLLEVKSGLSISNILDSWIEQPGYPVVRVELSVDGKELILEQERFMSGPNNEGDRGWRWMIPISVLVSDGDSKKEILELLMRKEDGATNVRLPNWFDASREGHWLKLNANFSGFYRVQYQRKLVELWQSAIKQTDQMSSKADRLNIVDDMLALSRANRVTTSERLEVMSWFDEGGQLR